MDRGKSRSTPSGRGHIMSDPNLPEDRSLVRRFNFLGFPGEKQNGGLTYASLRAQLGDDNASSLVVKIGVLAEKYHLNQLGVGIDGTIALILGLDQQR